MLSTDDDTDDSSRRRMSRTRSPLSFSVLVQSPILNEQLLFLGAISTFSPSSEFRLYVRYIGSGVARMADDGNQYRACDKVHTSIRKPVTLRPPLEIAVTLRPREAVSVRPLEIHRTIACSASVSRYAQHNDV